MAIAITQIALNKTAPTLLFTAAGAVTVQVRVSDPTWIGLTVGLTEATGTIVLPLTPLQVTLAAAETLYGLSPSGPGRSNTTAYVTTF